MRSDEDIRSHLGRPPVDVPPFEPRAEEVLRRVRGRRRRRYLLAGATAVVLVAGLVLPLAALSGLGSRNQPEGPDSRSSPSPATEPRGPRVAAEITLDGWPTQVEPGEGAVWVVAEGLVRIDPETNDVREVPVSASDVAVGAGGVWVAGNLDEGGQGVMRLDPVTGGEIASIPIDAELVGPIAADETSVWVGLIKNETPSVARIDPMTSEVGEIVPLKGSGLPAPESINGLADLVVAEGAVWVLVPEWSEGGGEITDGFVVKVDPASERVVGVVPVGYSLWLEAGEGSVWAQSGQGQAVRIDPATVEIAGEPIEVDGGFAPFGVGEGGVWFISDLPGGGSAEVSRLNPDTLEIDVSIAFEGTPTWSAGLDTSTHTVWVGTEEGSLIRIDLR